MKKHLPNLLTLLNLLSGTIAVILAVEGNLIGAGLFVILGIFFDFFDGFVARILKVEGELGKQLDSLADMVTSGVVPGIVLFQLIRFSMSDWQSDSLLPSTLFEEGYSYMPFIGLLITLAASYRLAKFNIDERQQTSFVGVPTPAIALLILSLPLILNYSLNEFAIELIQNKWFLIAVAVFGSYLMNANISLFSLKFKEYSFKHNKIKYLFMVLSILLLSWLQFVALPIIIVLYVVLSVVENKMNTVT